MKRFLLVLVSGALLTVAGRATDAIYHNIGTVNCPDSPQVDALAFVNDGRFCAQEFASAPFLLILIGPNLPLPYMTQNTLWFTNNGILLASSGFQLDYLTDGGIHHPAAAIVNSAGGPNGPANIFGSRFLFLSATNLVNKGLLEIGPFGLMQLGGGKLDLARSGVLVDPAASGGGCIADTSFSSFISPTNFFPFTGLVSDEYWGIGMVTNLASDIIAQQRGASLSVQAPRHAVTNSFAVNGFSTSFGPLLSPASFVRTNALTSTNWIVQAVFVGSSFGRLDPNITTQAKFVDNNYPENSPLGNGFKTAIVELKSVAVNAVTGQPITYGLYVVDQLANSTNNLSLTNLNNGITQRPATYFVDIYPPCSFFENATSTNAAWTPTLLYDPTTYSNRIVTATYAGYEAFLGTATGGSVLSTNTPGRVEISADNLDLTHARIRGESIVTVKTPHLIGSSGLVVDAPNINYNIASTNGLLSVSGTDLANPMVQRFGGVARMYSALWTNQTGTLSTNIGPDPNDPSMTVTNLTTNTVEIDFHVLIVDAFGLVTTSPVFLNEFSVGGTNVVLNDVVDATGNFAARGDNLTVNGSLILETSSWASTNVSLKTLTNNGSINIFDLAEFGTASRPYAAVVNNSAGSISGFGIAMDADLVQNSGTITAGGFLGINARTAKLEGGRLSAGNDMAISVRDLKMTGYRQFSGAFFLAVTNSLNDTGAGASNILTCNNGFTLPFKPALGDLFGTTLQSQAGLFQEANHIWSAEDRGPSPAGFINNAAIGHLVLNAADTSLLTFSGVGTGSALYVDFLELVGGAQTNLNSVLAINTNLVIYFADANVPVATLDGQFADSLQPNGRLRWVSDFAGPNSSVTVLLAGGQTTNMNKALRFSTTIDTDGDGVANGFDCFPLDPTVWNCPAGTIGTGATVSVVNESGARSVSLSWSGLPSGVYQVEYSTSLSAPKWQLLAGHTNVAVSSGTITILDKSIPLGETQRYYRVRYGP